MHASRNRPLRGLILVLDAILVLAAIAIAAGVHAALRGHVPMLKQPPRFQEYALIVYLTVPLWVALTASLGLHRVFERVWTRASLLFDLLKLHVVGFFALSAAVFFTQTTLNRSLVALFLGSSFVLSYAVRSALGYWQRYQHASGVGRVRLLVVGNPGREIQELLERSGAEPRPPVIVGQLGGEPVAGLQHLGGIEDLERVLHEQGADHVLFYPPYHGAADVKAALDTCDTVGVSAELAIEQAHPNDLAPRIVDFYGRPFLSFDPAPKPAERLAIKHAFDWIASVLLILLLSPLFLCVSIAILLTMGRPVFFAQTRAGLYGRQFKMIKFRTMVNNAEAKQAELAAKNEMTGPVFKVTDDPRVTRLGRFLRKTSIDELPQLFNVVLGQMSLVGPRPLPIKEQQQIRGWHRRRLSMKPGITCIWQISGRNNIDFEDWMSLDERYVDDWSLGLDLKILLLTVPVVLLRKGAR